MNAYTKKYQLTDTCLLSNSFPLFFNFAFCIFNRLNLAHISLISICPTAHIYILALPSFLFIYSILCSKPTLSRPSTSPLMPTSHAHSNTIPLIHLSPHLQFNTSSALLKSINWSSLQIPSLMIWLLSSEILRPFMNTFILFTRTTNFNFANLTKKEWKFLSC